MPKQSSGEPGEGLSTIESSVSPAAKSGDHPAATLWETPGRWPWGLILGGFWFLGSSLWFVLVALRVYRFERLIRRAKPASKWLEQEAAALAQGFGLSQCPPILMVHGRVPPLLWSMRRPSIVAVPSELLDRLAPAEQLMVIAHELAHFRRRDHWFRWIEMAILGVYCWHPVAWWARRKLQEAEEQCCDAWVLWAFPERTKSYARALLSTIEFLSASRSPLLLGASGLGTFYGVKRRFEMILQNRVDRGVSWRLQVGLILFACVALGASARIVLAEPQESEPAKESTAAPNGRIQTDPETTDAPPSEVKQLLPAVQTENVPDLTPLVELVNDISKNKEEYQRLARQQRVAAAELDTVGVFVWQYEPNRLGKLNRQLPVPIRDGFQNAFESGMFADVSRVSIWQRLDEKELEYVLQRLKSFPRLHQVASLEVVLPPEQIKRVKEALPNVQVELSKVFGRDLTARQQQTRSVAEPREFVGVRALGGPDRTEWSK